MLSTQLLSQLIRFYGDSAGLHGQLPERSMQVFLDQQQQFRQQMGNLLGQTPWAMMNQLTERNLSCGRNSSAAWAAASVARARAAPEREPATSSGEPGTGTGTGGKTRR